jgi:hypothetical protein
MFQRKPKNGEGKEENFINLRSTDNGPCVRHQPLPIAYVNNNPVRFFLVPMVLHRVRYPGFCPGLPWVLSRATLGSVQGAASVPERFSEAIKNIICVPGWKRADPVRRTFAAWAGVSTPPQSGKSEVPPRSGWNQRKKSDAQQRILQIIYPAQR